MRFDPGDLVAINTPTGYRQWPLPPGPFKYPDPMGVERGQRAIVLDCVVRAEAFPNHFMCKLLVGGVGIWWVESNLVSKVRLEFRHNELWDLGLIKQKAP